MAAQSSRGLTVIQWSGNVSLKIAARRACGRHSVAHEVAHEVVQWASLWATERLSGPKWLIMCVIYVAEWSLSGCVRVSGGWLMDHIVLCASGLVYHYV